MATVNTPVPENIHERNGSLPVAPAPSETPPAPAAAPPPARPSWARRHRKWLFLAATVVAVAAGAHVLKPQFDTALNTVSTDDAYVNGHVTLVAPRVGGQVREVLVDDNARVKKGDVLVRLDREPFEVQVALKKAAVRVAEANLASAESKARGLEAQLGTQRWKVQFAFQQVDAQVAQLKVKAANLRTAQAVLERSKADYERGKTLVGTGALTREDFDLRRQNLTVAEAQLNQAREEVIQVRVALGLPADPPAGTDLATVPHDLNQHDSNVRTALSEGVQTLAQLGLPLPSTKLTPNEVMAEFARLDAAGNIDRILEELVPKIPAVLQARSELEAARHDLEQAELNLKYCDVVSEIDGVVVNRNVNPGSHVQVGQSLMAVRSLTEVWVDANFKETQLADLRIGQRVRLEVDMYGGRQEFEGRITGFTMGTGQTLSLLPPQNATGNFVKIVQRLPVRIELTDYDPTKTPLFTGLSVTPYVYFKEPPTGPHAGEVLQPRTARSTAPAKP